MRLTLCALLLTSSLASAETAYRAIALGGGGHIVLRHGAAARADFVKGDARHTRVAVENGRLMVENCRQRCPDGYEMELAVTAPDVTALSVRDGGAIEALGSFPEQDGLDIAVSEGGAVDARAFAARNVTASVHDGGGIYAAPRARLAADVSQGGHVEYWGNPAVTRSIQDGGVIEPGRAADARKTLAQLRPKLPQIPPIPAIPPLSAPMQTH